MASSIKRALWSPFQDLHSTAGGLLEQTPCERRMWWVKQRYIALAPFVTCTCRACLSCFADPTAGVQSRHRQHKSLGFLLAWSGGLAPGTPPTKCTDCRHHQQSRSTPRTLVRLMTYTLHHSESSLLQVVPSLLLFGISILRLSLKRRLSSQPAMASPDQFCGMYRGRMKLSALRMDVGDCGTLTAQQM